MWGKLAAGARSFFTHQGWRSTAVKALGATGVVGLGYHMLNPRPETPVLPAEITPSPEQLGARAAVEDFSRQMEAMAMAQDPRLNPAFNQAMPQISGMGAELAGRVAGPELAMGAGR